MCHDADSRPPAPPRSGDVAERGTLTLTSADGTAVAAAHAAPAGEAAVGVVLLPGSDLDLAGSVGFYGRPELTGDAPAVRPTLMVIAGADAATPVEDQLALAERLRAGGAEVETAVYDGAPHSFFDRAYGDWAEACDDVWRRVLALTDRVAAGLAPRAPAGAATSYP